MTNVPQDVGCEPRDRPAPIVDEKGKSQESAGEPSFDPNDFEGAPPIHVTAAVLHAGVAYLFDSGLVHWNEPRQVVLVYVRDLLWELIEASEPSQEGTSTIPVSAG